MAHEKVLPECRVTFNNINEKLEDQTEAINAIKDNHLPHMHKRIGTIDSRVSELVGGIKITNKLLGAIITIMGSLFVAVVVYILK